MKHYYEREAYSVRLEAQACGKTVSDHLFIAYQQTITADAAQTSFQVEAGILVVRD